jgi:hypothetical protein
VPSGHGYLIGAHRNLLVDTPQNRQAAAAAIQRAQAAPATPADVHRATSADLNHDGFVTADEVIAMQRAGLGDMEIVRRLEATGHVLALSAPEREFLARHGVPRRCPVRLGAAWCPAAEDDCAGSGARTEGGPRGPDP